MQITINIPLTSDTDAPYTFSELTEMSNVSDSASYPDAAFVLRMKATEKNLKTAEQLTHLVRQTNGNPDSQVVYKGKMEFSYKFHDVRILDYTQNDDELVVNLIGTYTVDNAVDTK